METKNLNLRDKSVLICLTQILLWTLISCADVKVGPFPFQNISLSWKERVDDIVSRLTLDQIQYQMTKGGGMAPAIPELGINKYDWTAECLRGDAGPPNSTAFPQPIGLAATFSPETLYKVASAAGVEIRGKHNDYVKHNTFGAFTGANCFSPVVNIARDPRWGRNQETYGEDPFLTGVMAEHFIWGLQGNHSRYKKATAGCKHFDVHGGPENIPESRMTFDAKVSDLDWRTTFLPAFKKCVEAGTFSLMCSYNKINGIPACANKKLMQDILRDEWNFTGYVVSDEGAVEYIISSHHYINNSVDTAAECVKAGMNLELPNPSRVPVYLSIADAVNQSKLSEALVRERVKPLFYTRMRIGEFDPPENNPYASLTGDVSESPEHQALAIEAAAKSFVLLKNQNNILPLNPSAYKHPVVIGPMTDNILQLFGDYTPHQDRNYTKTPLQALQGIFPNIKTGNACLDGTPCKSYQSQVVKNLVVGADIIFVNLGTGQVIESEGRDRPDLELPGNQGNLLTDVIANNNNAKIVLLLFNAGPLNISVFDESPRVNAILEGFFPSQGAGDALGIILINKGGNSSPAGRLPMTWPRYDWQIPPMVNYSMVGRTYRYLETPPFYPFGYGLSYTTFSYDALTVNYYEQPRQNISVTLSVSNTGKFNADEVIQCYIKWENHSLPVPRIQLVYFNRFHIPAGGHILHKFNIAWRNWAYWNGSKWTVQTGNINIFCGGQQPNQKRSAPSNILTVNFPVYGDETAHKPLQEKSKIVTKNVTG